MTPLGHAQSLIKANISVVPIKTDGSKKPAIRWKPYQKRRMTAEETERLFSGDCGVGIIAGAVSGNLEVIDVEGPEKLGGLDLWPELSAGIEETVPGLLANIPQVRTPSGGLHLYYRCETIERSQTLAMRHGSEGKREVLIETRGEGGQALAPGSPAACHLSGKTYDLVAGQITQTPTITPEQRDGLLGCCRTFNSWIPVARIEAARKVAAAFDSSRCGRPGDDYNRRGPVLELLLAEGWAVESRHGDEYQLRRPGKESGCSATWHPNKRFLWVFSTSADQLYEYCTPFFIYTQIKHGGDFGAAVQQLTKDGYGGDAGLRASTVQSARPAHAAGDGRGVGGGSGCPAIAYRKLSEIASKKIDWLWKGWIARGKVTGIAGDPGLGKSQITLGIAASVSTGGKLPDGAPCKLGRVIIVSAEDNPADTIRPRLEAAGANLDNVLFLDAVNAGCMPDGSPSQRGFNLGEDLAKLSGMINEIGEVSLIIFDPITAFLGSTDSHKNAEVRALLSPLSKVAESCGAAVVFVSHLNKAGGNDALMRVTGSLAFVAAARAAYLVIKDPADDERRLFLPMKNNLGSDRTGLAFRIDSAQVESKVGLIPTSRVVWQTGPVTMTAAEAMRAAAGGLERPSAVTDAGEWLTDLLRDGPLPVKSIRAGAKKSGFAWRTVERAKGALGVKADKDGLSGPWIWTLDTEDRQEDPKKESLAAFEDSQRSSKTANELALKGPGGLREIVEVEL